MQAENELLRQKSQELEQQNQQLQNELSNVVVRLVRDCETVRDHIIKNWRIIKAPETKERIKKALDMLIEGITRE